MGNLNSYSLSVIHKVLLLISTCVVLISYFVTIKLNLANLKPTPCLPDW